MIEVLWEIAVNDAARARFELIFGPGGAWSKLAAASGGFRGTTLLCDAAAPQRYLVIEVWDEETDRAEMEAAHPGELAALEAAFAECGASRRRLGVFTLRSQAAVRPLGRKRGGRG